ncbi:SDR family NAD(P)-dependent oxidoreductase [Pseudonocardia spinosispora]|uniref:SDR family NAD(P)-dependent oxidoreductase n=1 Tax=Pseudonocardia spinosispora TaxID=103441 RepID=UPI0006840AAF|nr:SDR family NAD(P)-dependent oxidoreductase [Pseudonocardia spinosispora]
MKFGGAVAVVTGAGSGIGAALARETVRRGATAVAVVDIDKVAADATAEALDASGVRANAYRCDVADVAAVEQVAATISDDLGTPTFVCANAGVTPAGGPLLEAEHGDLTWALEVNVVGVWATISAFGRRLADSRKSGWILVTASEHSLGVPFPGGGFYTASKHAVLALADVLRLELPEQIGISAMTPGLVNTNIWRGPQLRPASHGGPSDGVPLVRKLIESGIDPDVIARLALDGVEKEEFLIATHAHALRYATTRHAHIERSFTELASTGLADTSYDAMELAASFEPGTASS